LSTATRAIADSPALTQRKAQGSEPDATTKAGRFPTIALSLTMLLLSFTLLPRVQANPRLVMTFAGVSIALLIWELVLWIVAERRGQRLRIEFAVFKSHYVQALAQLCIMLWWGWFARDVYNELPLVAAQLIFLYTFDALLSWSLGRTWRIGFGPLPIIFSTNLLLWFKDDYFYLQFLMVAAGAMGKQFIMWQREGRRRHIFNPSSFGQFLFAIVLIATATTNDLTFGREIAATFETPGMLVVIFAVGLVVQYLFHVTLMTLAAAATLMFVNVAYTQITGTYFFVNISIAAPIFLGIHLLITDPSTSPVTNTGRVMFGVLYALGYCALFRILDLNDVPLFWDKLLPVPILNLCVPLFDRLARGGLIGSFNQRWESALPAAKLNLVHMGCWIALFAGMMATGFVGGDHPGNSIAFWKQAIVDGKPHAGHSLVMAAGSQAEAAGSGAAFNELGLICIEGKIVNENHGTAARYFARACELGNFHGCANCAVQYLFLGERRSDDDVALALEKLELQCAESPDEMSCFLVGYAYEEGRGRPADARRAVANYERCSVDSLLAAKGIARIVLASNSTQYELHHVIPTLERAAAAGDDESCWYLAYIYAGGFSVERDEAHAIAMMQRACDLGSAQACDVLRGAQWPAFAKPIMLVPGWSTAYHVE
jgi:TPR repeat protein